MASIHNQLVQEANYNTIAKAQQEAASKANSSSSNSKVASQDFLYLLTMQLQYQDPTNPMDNSEMLAQEAQFSTLEQMEALTSSFSKFSNMYQANSLLGQNVEVEIDGRTASGKVDYIDYSDTSGAAVSINGTNYPLSSVTKVFPQTQSEASSEDDKNFLKEALSYIAGNIGYLTEKLAGTAITDTIGIDTKNN